MEPLLGIDISNNNPGVDMPTARRQGVSVLVAKCSQGWAGGPGGWMDWTFVDIVNRARAAGIPVVGGYHWGLRGNGAAQAQQFVRSLERVGGPRGLLCALDIERNDWNQGLNIDAATVDDFLREWDQITSLQPILLYGASWYHDGYLGAGARWPNRPLWWAGYNGAAGQIQSLLPSVTPGWMVPFGGWTSYAIRQFTSQAVAGGVTVDANVTYLSLSQLHRLTQPGLSPGTDMFRAAALQEGLVMDPEVQARFDAIDRRQSELLMTLQQIVTVVQGIPKGKPNPFGLIGTQDLAVKLDRIISLEERHQQHEPVK